jgi:type II secretory pathway pseudopilin PulG
MKSVKANSLCLILATSIALSSAMPSMADVGGDQEIALLQQKQKQLADIQAQLDQAQSAAELHAVLNALAIAGETLFASMGGIKFIYQPDKREAAMMQFATAFAVISAHIAYFTMAPSRRETNQEKALQQQKQDVQKLIDQLKADTGVQADE